MGNVISDCRDGCATVRLQRGATNALTTEFITSLTAALHSAEQDNAGVMLCGGESFFSNGVDLEWALGQSRAQVRELFVELGACILQLLESWRSAGPRSKRIPPASARLNAHAWRLVEAPSPREYAR